MLFCFNKINYKLILIPSETILLIFSIKESISFGVTIKLKLFNFIFSTISFSEIETSQAFKVSITIVAASKTVGTPIPITGIFKVTIFPLSLSFFTNEGFSNPIKIVANTENMQAVVNEEMGQYAVVFYEPGSIRFPDGLCLSVDKKSLIYVERKGTQYEFAVADPLYKEQSVRITINKTLAGKCVDVQGENSILETVFPVGDYAGSTVLSSVEEVL